MNSLWSDARAHRRREREHLASLRYAVRNRLYDMAFRELMYAFQQATVADLKEKKDERRKR